MDAGLPFTRLPAGAERRLLPAAVLLWVERAWADGPLKAVAAAWSIYLTLALMGVWGGVPGSLRVAVLGLLVAGSLAGVVLALRRTALPRRAALIRRIEAASGVRRGALALLDGSAVDLSDPVAAQLWGRAVACAPQRVRLGPPRLALDDGERAGFVPLLLAGLLIGALLAKDSAPQRLADALSPYPAPLSAARVTVTVEAPRWAEQPPRTLALRPGATTEITALQNSRLSFRAEGLRGPWYLRLPGGGEAAFADGVAQLTVTSAGPLLLRSGSRRVAAVDLTLAADGAPAVTFDGAPTVTPNGALRIAYRIADDFGAVGLSLELRRRGALRRIALAPRVRSGAGAVFADLTPDPFAGTLVEMRLVARDGSGQTGFSPALRVRLPERQFKHPVAREIIAVRKRLIAAPDAREPVAKRLSEIASQPARFGENLSAFVGLRAATWRLAYDQEDLRARSTVRLLWDVAVDIEDGGTSRAMEAMREAMDALTRAMQSGDDQLLKQLTDRLSATMAEYLARQIADLAESGQIPPGQTLDLSFLDAMMQDLKDRLAAGDQAGAAQALADIRRLMESLRFGGGDPQAAARAQAAQAAARAAQDLETRQRDLQAATIAESVRRAMRGTHGAMAEQADEQGRLAATAGALRRQAQASGLQTPGALDAAEAAMAAAQTALAAGKPSQAMQAQERAIRALSTASQQLEAQAQALQRQAGGGLAQPGTAGSGVDPLGRPGQGFGQGTVKLPDPQTRAQIEAIRRLLEERAADPKRSADERAYYLRLLKRF